MAYKVIILYRLYMPSYFLGTFTEYPFLYITSIYQIDNSWRTLTSSRSIGLSFLIAFVNGT